MDFPKTWYALMFVMIVVIFGITFMGGNDSKDIDLNAASYHHPKLGEDTPYLTFLQSFREYPIVKRDVDITGHNIFLYNTGYGLDSSHVPEQCEKCLSTPPTRP